MHVHAHEPQLGLRIRIRTRATTIVLRVECLEQCMVLSIAAQRVRACCVLQPNLSDVETAHGLQVNDAAWRRDERHLFEIDNAHLRE